MKTGLGLLAFAALLAVTACGRGGTSSAAADVPANFNSIVSALSSAVAQESSDLNGETKDVNNGQGDSAGACDNLQDNVDYDVKTNIGRDEQNVAYDVGNLKDAISAVRQDMNNLVTDVTAIANEGVNIPPDVNAFVSSANTQIKQAIAQANSEIDQANGTVSDAYSTANGLATGKCSGDGPGSKPGAIGHLS
jgi:archaellum component FlaC